LGVERLIPVKLSLGLIYPFRLDSAQIRALRHAKVGSWNNTSLNKVFSQSDC
jgi:hypothetical protein